MTITPHDLRILRIPLIIFTIVLALSVASVIFTRSQLKQTNTALENQQRNFSLAQTRFRKSGEERDIIIRHLPAYRTLEQQGFIGVEQRINWLDAIRLTNQEMKMFGAEYQIGAQQPYPPAPELDTGTFQLHQSTMKLSFKLLHEGDLMRFFDNLTQLKAAFFTLDECTLQRLANNPVTLHFQPSIQATCQLNWITITPNTVPRSNP